MQDTVLSVDNRKSEATIRISLEVPGVPRFLFQFSPSKITSLKDLIAEICQQTGLEDTTKNSYILYLEDSVVLHLD